MMWSRLTVCSVKGSTWCTDRFIRLMFTKALDRISVTIHSISLKLKVEVDVFVRLFFIFERRSRKEMRNSSSPCLYKVFPYINSIFLLIFSFPGFLSSINAFIYLEHRGARIFLNCKCKCYC